MTTNTGRFSGWGRHFHRPIFFSLVILTTLGAMSLLSAAIQDEGITPLELALLILYAILMLWITASFWTAALGFARILRRMGRRAPAGDVVQDHPEEANEPFKTALVMPVYNEDPQRVFAGLRAIVQSLAETGHPEGFEIFVLSDTRDPETWIQEELQWRQWALELGQPARLFYRNRVENTARKSGNLADFCRQWGGRYRYMIVLDADSIMTGETLLEMVRRMESDRRVALIQVPPVPVNRSSLFARMLQFAGSLYGNMFVAGLAYWQQDTANFWGHNAIIRVRPFAEHCGLPQLPGHEPFGGEILSHDFVEAALLARAGWKVRLADDLGGSYEEIPPTLIDYAKRDRRWCQGNLQHSRLILARGFKSLSRIHFAMGVMSYLASPLWLLFLIATGIEAYFRSLKVPVYFFGDNVLPVWPESYAVEMATVLWVTLALLFLPKLLSLVLLAFDPIQARRFGGLPRAALSVLIESFFSVLLAPVLMLFQSKFVAAILLRTSVGWPAQERGDHQTGLAEAVGAHGVHTLIAVAAGVATYTYVPAFFWWFTPVLAGLALSIPVSMITSRTSIGRLARRAGLFMTPEETEEPRVLQLLEENLVPPPGSKGAATATPLGATPNARDLWSRAVMTPATYALHASLLPDETPSRRRHHALEGLLFKLQDEGSDSLTTLEKRTLISHRDGLYGLHTLLWAELEPPPTSPRFPGV
ncbi:glucans biosynthesis glucosyltransferase MdoH [Thiocystis violascens]|uniref:Glucans biosynthesis glucosyltransferase H n=1 Tax=Thiocystis violascens (strain ATCC 17096 / DSM 198 / 6111) TaxID=765911 RepID=I3Y8I1_THIV6|nr:glucans biosynthesis glucosyltransferase MdoH [Thiocystis violascens]AFL73299.1 membrane glycosyltransferase [Thiocystis violascens DSM 198]